MPRKPSILIIGAGMAGLSAGCYARFNGFPTTIIEQQQRPGGLCQSWERDAFCINGCVHWLVGSSGGGRFADIWQELGISPNTSFYDHDRLKTFVIPGGEVTLYADPDRLEKHLVSIAPEDADAIRGLCRAVRALRASDFFPPQEPEGLWELLGQARMLLTHFPLIRQSYRWWQQTIGEFAASLRNPQLRLVFSRLWHADMSMITVIMTLAFLARRDAGYPLGGSSELMNKVEARYRALGGKVRYGQRVDAVLVRGGRARGVRLTTGEELRADYVISAADGYTTLYSLLRGQFPDPKVVGPFTELKPFPPLLYAGIGVKRTFPEWTPSVMGAQYALEPPMVIGCQIRHHLDVQVYTFDDSLAPAGHTLLVVSLEADFDFWREMARQYQEYKAFKRQTLDQMIEALDRLFPGIKGQVVVRDLATPITFHQYTGNYRGSYEGWLPTPRALRTHIPKTLEGLDHFYLAGHWVEPGGGLPPAALSGKKVIQAICRQGGHRFRTMAPERPVGQHQNT